MVLNHQANTDIIKVAFHCLDGFKSHVKLSSVSINIALAAIQNGYLLKAFAFN